MTDQEFDELRELLTRARNYGGTSIDGERFRELMRLFYRDLNKDERESRESFEHDRVGNLPLVAPGETAHIHLDKRLGSIQKQVLTLLREHGHWWPGCGWRWNTHTHTDSILKTLVVRGYARKDGHKYFPVEPKCQT